MGLRGGGALDHAERQQRSVGATVCHHEGHHSRGHRMENVLEAREEAGETGSTRATSLPPSLPPLLLGSQHPLLWEPFRLMRENKRRARCTLRQVTSDSTLERKCAGRGHATRGGGKACLLCPGRLVRGLPGSGRAGRETGVWGRAFRAKGTARAKASSEQGMGAWL